MIPLSEWQNYDAYPYETYYNRRPFKFTLSLHFVRLEVTGNWYQVPTLERKKEKIQRWQRQMAVKEAERMMPAFQAYCEHERGQRELLEEGT